MREMRAFVPMGPVPPKFTGCGTMTSPGLPDSATYNTPSGAKTIPFGFTRPRAYTSTCVTDCAETGAAHRATMTNNNVQRYTAANDIGRIRKRKPSGRATATPQGTPFG